MGPFKDCDVARVAQADPVAALALAIGATWVPLIANVVAEFSSGALNTPVDGDLDTTLATPTYVQDMVHTIVQPGFAGSLFKPEFDQAYKTNSGIQCEMVIEAGPKYVISVNYTPLENLTERYSEKWPDGWILRKLQSIKTSFILTQPPNDDQFPMTVTITIRGWQVAEEFFADVTPLQARELLCKLGYKVPDFNCILPDMR